MTSLSRLCIHTITTRPWPIEVAARHYADAGVGGITVWREALEGRDIQATGRLLRDEGLKIVSLCRGGFFPSTDKKARMAAIDQNKRAIEEAHMLGTDMVVLVCGADPAQSLETSRVQILEGITAVLPNAEAANVRLAIEPLHPMYADTRSAINTLSQANDIAEAFNSRFVGVAIDVYHVWWDPQLQKEIVRCGKNGKLFGFHLCDWKTPTTDILFDRGVIGEGCIPVNEITKWVDHTGFRGYHEVEIFSHSNWSMDQSTYLLRLISAYKQNIFASS